MHVVEIGPINNNPQTSYKLVFGYKVSADKVLESLREIAEMRQKLGFTTPENTRQTLDEAAQKIASVITN